MGDQSLNSILISFLFIASAHADTGLPKWITEGKLSDPSHYFVICSHEGLDPEEVKQIAESKCLASAAKLGGATVTVRQKTVQSLTGSDSAEVAEIQPLTRVVDCVWTDRLMEKIQNGFRVWLRCQVDRSAVQVNKTESGIVQLKSKPPKKYKRGLLNLISVPVADRVLVLTNNGERIVIEVKSNVEKIEIHEEDISIIVRKQKYRDQKVELGEWSNGSLINKSVYLEKDF